MSVGTEHGCTWLWWGSPAETWVATRRLARRWPMAQNLACFAPTGTGAISAMIRRALLAILGAVSLWPMAAHACYVVPTRPDQLVKEEEQVLIAYPIAMSYVPREAGNPSYRGRFRQTILWKVVVSWKGKYQPGNQFTTRQQVDNSGMCGGGVGKQETRPLLLAFSGTEPYASFSYSMVEFDPEVFQYFQDTRVRKAPQAARNER